MTQPETVEETTIKFDVETTTETTETQSDVIKRVEALEKLADDRHKAYGVMFVNLQKQIELLTIKTRNSISGLGDNQSKLWKSRK